MEKPKNIVNYISSLMTGIIKRILPFLILAFIFSMPVLCQNVSVPVVKSQEKILYHGKLYYLHKVVKGQTLYSISRAYGVSEQEVMEANPGLVITAIKTGQVLKIPVKTDQENSTKGSQSPPVTRSDSFIYHVVRPKQTVFYLHELYNVPVEEIYHYNPGTENGLKVGQVIRIPRMQKEVAHQEKKEVQPKEQHIATTTPQESLQPTRTYEVQPGDSLYKIANRFGVREADLVNVNTQLRWGLKAGQVLTIPEKQSNEIAGISSDSLFIVSTVAGFSAGKCDSIKELSGPHQLRIALMLPFFTKEAFEPDTTVTDSADNENTQPRDVILKGRGSAEFYEGVLLALDSLKKTGLDASLFVYDTEADTNKVKNILKDLDVVRPNLIIGPFSTDDVRLVSRYSAAHHIPFVPPLTQGDTIVRRNAYMFQSSPSFSTELNLTAKYLARYDTDNIVLIYKNSLLIKDRVDQFKEAVYNRFSSLSIPDSSIFSEMNFDSVSTSSFQRVLKLNKTNLVIVLSSEEPDVIKALNQLHQMEKYYNYDITVMGLPIWQKFKNVRVDFFHDLSVFVYSPFYIDYNNVNVKKFVRECRKKLGYEPYKTSAAGAGYNFTFLGYDLSLYFMPLVRDYGQNLCDCVANVQHPELLSRYNFVRDQHSGCFENKSLNIIQYMPNYTIRKITSLSTTK